MKKNNSSTSTSNPFLNSADNTHCTLEQFQFLVGIAAYSPKDEIIPILEKETGLKLTLIHESDINAMDRQIIVYSPHFNFASIGLRGTASTGNLLDDLFIATGEYSLVIPGSLLNNDGFPQYVEEDSEGFKKLAVYVESERFVKKALDNIFPQKVSDGTLMEGWLWGLAGHSLATMRVFI